MKVSFLREVLAVYARTMEANAQTVREAGDSPAIDEIALTFAQQKNNADAAYRELVGLDDDEEFVPASSEDRPTEEDVLAQARETLAQADIHDVVTMEFVTTEYDNGYFWTSTPTLVTSTESWTFEELAYGGPLSAKFEELSEILNEWHRGSLGANSVAVIDLVKGTVRTN